MDKKNTRVFFQKTNFYLWTIFLLVLVIAYLNYWFAIPCFAILVVLVVHNLRSNYRRQKEITSYIENLTFNISSASKDTLLNFPLPLVVVELDGTIVWYNSASRTVFGDEKLFDKKIDNLVKGLNPQEIVKESEKISLNAEINYRNYRVMGNFVKTDESSDMGAYLLVLYFIDNTELKRIQDKYKNEKTQTGIIVIDNYDDLMQSVDDAVQPQLLAEIDRKINDWFSFTDGIIKKLERDRYMFIFEYRHLAEMKNRKFDILDDVKEIKLGNKIPVTLSIGIGVNTDKLEESFDYASASIDLALARGGDQVVIKDGDNFSFYGGRTREIEKRTRVKARVIAYALRELMDQAANVLIMGHENGDLDSLGASLGMYRIAKSRNKDARIVLGKINANIVRLVNRIKEKGKYEEIFISRSEAVEAADEKTLLIVVDTHRPSFTECPELLQKTEQIVVVDHHRRGTEFIQDPVLIYQEAYASSTSELVTEILQYVDDKIELTSEEADGMFAGIVLDTKNFTFKTGVRTFDAASYLRRKGADTLSVKDLFKNDLATFNAVAEIVKNSEIFNGNIAISVVPDNVENSMLVGAKAADELLMLSETSAAFVLSKTDDGISISGRSYGDINVQAILEKLGGGGHLTVAGAQLDEKGINKAIEQLKYAIMNYIEESLTD